MSLIPSPRLRSSAVVMVLLIAVLAIFAQTSSFPFVAWDDPDYVTQNPIVRAGLTRESVVWAFTDTTRVNWHPLTWLSHMLDVELWGADAGGHHRTNVFLHLANSLLVYFVFFSMTGAWARSALLALLFAIHPLHVEPVAWVSERKELLCTFFSLLTIAAHGARVRSVERDGRSTLGASVVVAVAFAWALMAKSMAVTLPFVLLLLDVWPLRRALAWRLVVEKLPLFGLALAASLVAVLTQRGEGAVVSLDVLPIGARLSNAVVSVSTYLRDVVWPVNLIHFYPHPFIAETGGQPLGWPVVAGGAALWVALTIAAVAYSSAPVRASSASNVRRAPDPDRLPDLDPACTSADARGRAWALVGWCWFLGTLVPVLGLVQVGQQGHADRYVYFPSIGLFLVVVWGIGERFDRLPARSFARRAFALGLAFGVATLGALAWRQTGYWRDSATLFRHAVEVEPRNVLVRFNVANGLRDEGRLEEAVAEYERILDVTPDSAEANLNLANVLRRQGQIDRAITHYERALARQPDYQLAHLNLASALRERGDFDQAVVHYERALALGANRATLFNLGNLYRARHQHEKAIPLYEQALSLGRADARIESALAQSLLATGRVDDAIDHFRKATRLAPRDADAANNLGVALEEKGDVDAAIAAYRDAIGRSADHRRAHSNLGLLLLRRREVDEARIHFERAVLIDPQNADARRALEEIRGLLSQPPIEQHRPPSRPRAAAATTTP